MFARTKGFGLAEEEGAEEPEQLPAPGKVTLTSRLAPRVHGEATPSYLLADPGVAGARADRPRGDDPYGLHLIGRSFGEDFSDVDLRFGSGGDAAVTSFEGGRDVVRFDSASPSREQVAHELTHVAQRRRFGEGTGGYSRLDDAAEHEARDLAGHAAAGRPVTVRAAPAARMQMDASVARNIYQKLRGQFLEDEKGAVGDLRGDGDRAGTCATYWQMTGGVTLWADFIARASGATMREALTLCWPFMPLLERLATHVGTFDDDEGSILQTIENASDAELVTARTVDGGKALERYLQELSAVDRHAARRRIYPEDPLGNVLLFLQEGHGLFLDDEGPVATAILNLTPGQRLELWQRHQDQLAMFSERDKQKLGRMCSTADHAAVTDAQALRARMELATDGAGTDDDGVFAALAAAGNRRDEQAAIDAALTSGRGPDGRRLTDVQRARLTARRAEIGDVDTLLTPVAGADGLLKPSSFLGRVQDDLDAGAVDHALTVARSDAYTRAKQALLMTIGPGGLDVDEAAALAILRDVRGDLELAPGETLDDLAPDELQRRQDRATIALRQALRADAQLDPVWRAFDHTEQSTAAELLNGDHVATAVRELTAAYRGIDSDEAAMLRIVTALAPADREALAARQPPILAQIRAANAGTAFERAFDTALRTGRVPTADGLDAAFGAAFDTTDETMATDVLAGLGPTERARYRRGYLLAHSPAAPRTPADEQALAAYNALHARMASELTEEELDHAIGALLGLPTVEELLAPDGLQQAATLMLLRQRERMQLGGGLTGGVSTTDDTAASAHRDFEVRYEQALADGAISEDEFAVLVHLDQQFHARFRDFADTANLVSEVAGTVGAVVAAAAAVILSGPAAPATAPGVLAWLSANSTLIGFSAAAGAIGQLAGAELGGGAFHESLDADGARDLLSGALNGALAICGAALAEKGAALVGLSGKALTAEIARSAANATAAAVAPRFFARGVLTGLIDGSLGGSIGELTMTLTDAETWRRSVWGVLARAGGALLRGGVLGGATGAGASGLLEAANGMAIQRVVGKVDVSFDDGLQRAAHLDFRANPETGQLTNMRLRIGRHATDGTVAAHVDRLRAIQRASWFRARVRELATRAGLAEQEALKIRQLLDDRIAELQLPMSNEARAVIESEVELLEHNLVNFQRVADSGDTTPSWDGVGQPTRPSADYPHPPKHHYYRRRDDGWDLQLYPDAPEGVKRFTLEPKPGGGWRRVQRPDGGPPPVYFLDDIEPADAFDELMATNPSFQQYVDMLEHEGLLTRGEIIAEIAAPGGRTHTAVRHDLKDRVFRPLVLRRCVQDADGVDLDEAASVLALRRYTDPLNESDRGNLVEAWYQARHKKLKPHPKMTDAANPGLVAGRDNNGLRRPDFLEGTELVEMKSTGGGLEADEVLQIEDDLRVCGSPDGTVAIGGVDRRVASLRLVFTDIEGARGAAGKLQGWLDGHAFFTVEVYGTGGVRTRISAANLERLQRQHGVTSLADLLGAM